MHRQVVSYYGDDGRAREMELAAAERRTSCCSCSPLGKMISRAITEGSHNGREGGRRRRPKKEVFDYATAYPPAETYYVRPNARTITVTTAANNTHHHHHPVNAQVQSVPPEPTRSYAAVPDAHPHAGGSGKPRKKKKKKRVTFNPEAAAGPMTMPANAHAGHAPQHATMAASSTGGAAGSVYHHGAGAEQYSPAPPPVHGHAYGYGYGYGRYAPSPLTRREAVGTPRRHEYFSGEYRWYYPTPVRESIYSFATDANHRLTAFFSEENPNACTIF